MSERRLSQVLTRRFSRVAWTALIGYAVVVVLLFAVAAEMALRRSLEHSADFIQSLLGAYRDSTSAPGGVMPSTLADQLVGMGGQVVITRTTTNAGGMPQVYYLSPGMPARRLEGLPDAPPAQARAALVSAITERARWRYRVLHRAMGEFDIYVVASRQSYFIPLGVLVVAAALLLPLAAFAAARGARQAVDKSLVVHAEPAARIDVIGDADRTRHILLNLASNAVRYTPSGSVVFAIIPHGKEVGVSVQDTGPGIAPEHLDRIFDRFFRIDQSRSRELGGTGLGLAIARLLAELQGGRIEVNSTPGQGTTFTLWLPGLTP